mmetsp:Transcript_30795/g.69435  ORF Transcript_30795/g.69435 Transcript_30795/m.69435 type:complete len:229 (-) Transcript_30795:4979-5665(-)
MHVDNHEGVDLLSLLLAQFLPHLRHQVVQLLRQQLVEGLDRVLLPLLHLAKAVLHLPRPPELAAPVDCHSQVLLDPSQTSGLGVMEDPLLHDGMKRRAHLPQDVGHPVLDRSLRGHGRPEAEVLALGGDHSYHHLVLPCEDETCAVVEDLETMLLDRGHVRRPQHGQHLIVGDEEEPREGVSFGVEEVRQALLTPIQVVRQLPEQLKSPVDAASLHHVPLLVRLLHDL